MSCLACTLANSEMRAILGSSTTSRVPAGLVRSHFSKALEELAHCHSSRALEERVRSRLP